MAIQQLNAQAHTVRAERHNGSSLWLIRSIGNGKVLNSAMSYEWAVSSLKDWIDFEARHGVTQ